MKFRFSIFLPILIAILNLGIYILISLHVANYILLYLVIDLPGIFFTSLLSIGATNLYIPPGITIIFYFGIGLLIDIIINIQFGHPIKKKAIKMKAKITSRDPDEFPR